MWDNVLRVFRETLDKAEVTYTMKAKSTCFSLLILLVFLLSLWMSGFNCTEEENLTSLAALRKRAWLALRAKIDEQTADMAILGKLRSHFEERFRYDEVGVPRVWKPDDDIDGAFKKAKDQVCLIFLPVVLVNLLFFYD
jgi:hypothetical protein